jgi:hypothetical protein
LRAIKPDLEPIVHGAENRVLDAAKRSGLVVVDVDFVRQVLGALLETSKFATALASKVQRDHADTLEDVIKEGKRHGRVDEKIRQVDSFRAGFESSTRARVRDAVLGDHALARALRSAAPDDPAVEAMWRQAASANAAAIVGKTGEERKTVLTELAEDLERLAPARDYASMLDRLRAGDDCVVEEVVALIARSASRGVEPTLSRLAPRGVSSVPMPTVSEFVATSWSGDVWFPVTMRNFGSGGGAGLDVAMRNQAYEASTAGRPMRVLELTRGLALNALPFTRDGNIRSFGDFLLCRDERGSPGPGSGRLQKFSAPQLEATVVAGRDMTRAWIDGELPERYRSWREINGWLNQRLESGPAELRAAYDDLQKSGKLHVRQGDPVDSLLGLIREGKRFDLAVFHELAWNANRMQLLQTLQAAMAPGGVAFVPLETWAPVSIMDRAGVEGIVRFKDTVASPKGDVPLAEYLADQFPEAFELRRGAGVKTLVVKGTREPVDLPAMDAQPTGETVDRGFPVLRWAPAS